MMEHLTTSVTCYQVVTCLQYIIGFVYLVHRRLSTRVSVYGPPCTWAAMLTGVAATDGKGTVIKWPPSCIFHFWCGRTVFQVFPFNRACVQLRLSRTRRIVENPFGILAGRFCVYNRIMDHTTGNS